MPLRSMEAVCPFSSMLFIAWRRMSSVNWEKSDGNRAVGRVVAKGLTKHFPSPIDDFEELLDVLAVGPCASRNGDDDGREDEGQHVAHQKPRVVVHGVALDVLDERVDGVRNLRLEEAPKTLALQAFHALALPFFDVQDLLHTSEPNQPSHLDLVELDAGDGVPKVAALPDELGQRDGREVVLVPGLAHASKYWRLERPHGDRIDPLFSTSGTRARRAEWTVVGTLKRPDHRIGHNLAHVRLSFGV